MKAKQLHEPAPKIECLIHFHEDWRSTPNALLRDDKGNLFLASVHYAGRDMDYSQAERTPVSLRQAVEWAVKHDQFADCGDTDWPEFIEMTLAYLPEK